MRYLQLNGDGCLKKNQLVEREGRDYKGRKTTKKREEEKKKEKSGEKIQGYPMG